MIFSIPDLHLKRTFTHTVGFSSKLRTAATIWRREGVEGVWRIVSRKLRMYAKPYKPKNIFYYVWYDGYVVKINGLLVDIKNNSISKNIKNIILEGTYESAEVELIKEHVKEDVPVIDLGAGIGLTTCVISVKVGKNTPVVGVEANPSIIPVIERNKTLNSTHFDVISAAYNSDNRPVDFGVNNHFWASSTYDIGEKKQERKKVPGVSLEEIIDKFRMKTPVQVVADIEGSENDLIMKESSFISNHVSLLVVEHHDFTERSKKYYTEELETIGFDLIDRKGRVYVYSNNTLL